MADSDLAVSGKDTRIQVLLNGGLFKVEDQITNFSKKPIYDEIVTKAIGESGSYVDKEFVGWEGTVDLNVTRKEVDELMDAVNAALVARVPVIININSTTSYRNGESASYVYPDVKLEYERSGRRGEAQSVSLSWKTGKDRIKA